MENAAEKKFVENRKMERFSLGLEAQVAVVDRNNGADEYELETADICAGGAYFSTERVVPLGTKVSIDLVLPLDRFKKVKAKKALIEVTGRVIRAEDSGMAVCFDRKYKISPMHA